MSFARLDRTRAFATGLAQAAMLPLVAAAGGLAVALFTWWEWRIALRRAAGINGVDPAPLLASYPLSRVCGAPAHAFEGCDTAAAAVSVAAAAGVMLAALVVVAASTAVRLRRAADHLDRFADALGRSVSLATIATGVVLAAATAAAHIAVGVPRFPLPIASACRAVIWIGCAAVALRLLRASQQTADTEPDRFDGVPLDPADAPQLFALIDEVAGRLRVPVPDHVVAGAGSACFVTSQPMVCDGDRLFGVTLQLSIPWCRRLTADELTAVIAHELAHVAGGDIRFGERIGPVIERAARVRAAASVGPMTSALDVFAQTYFHVAQPVRAAQEARADLVSARIAGPRAAASAMVKIELACGGTLASVADRVAAIGADPGTAWTDATRPLPDDAWTRAVEAPDLERRAMAAETAERSGDAPEKPPFLPPTAARQVAWAIVVLAIAGAVAWRSPRVRAPRPAPAIAQVADPRGAEPMPDPVLLLDDLHAGRYDSLDAAIVDAVRRSRTSPRDELVSEAAFRPFGSADPRLAPHLDAWIEQRPTSAVALVARAEYRSGLAWEARGGAYRTSSAQRAEMSRLFALGTADARAAQRLDPILVEADVALLRMGPVIGGCDELATEGLAKRPSSYRLRSLYLHCMLPRWRGTYRDLRAFAIASLARAGENPRLHALGGWLDWDAGRLASAAGDDDLALAFHARALAYGPDFQVHRARAIIYTRRDDEPAALADVDAALRLHPDDADLVRRRASLLAAVGRLEDAAEATLRAERLDPGMPDLPDTRRFVAHWLLKEGDARGRRGDHAAALRLLQPVLLLQPGNEDACSRVAFILRRAERHGEAETVSRTCAAAQTR